MIIDYIGQELIWNLTATHPYKPNRKNYSIMINCKNPKQNKDAAQFLKSHFDDKLMTVETRKYVDKNTGWNTFLLAKCPFLTRLAGLERQYF